MDDEISIILFQFAVTQRAARRVNITRSTASVLDTGGLWVVTVQKHADYADVNI